MIEINGMNYLTAKEAADKVGATKSYICRMCRNGTLTAKKTELGWLIPSQMFNVQWANRRK